MPDKHVLVVEDDLLQQARFAKYLLSLFGHQSNVRVSIVPSAVDAHVIIFSERKDVDLVILDHDLQLGNGGELVQNMRASGIHTPVITASGITSNNDRMMSLGADYYYTKDEVINGSAQRVILDSIGYVQKTPGWEGIL